MTVGNEDSTESKSIVRGKVLYWCKIQKWWNGAGNKTTIVFSCYGNYSTGVEMYVLKT